MMNQTERRLNAIECALERDATEVATVLINDLDRDLHADLDRADGFACAILHYELEQLDALRDRLLGE